MTRAFWAPGRVNLIGEHTDYTGGFVLPVALDLGIRIEGVAAETINLTSDAQYAGTGWSRFVSAVAVELAELGRPPVGLEGTITSTLPSGAGLSSSAALEVALATALCAVADFPLEPLELARLAQRAEHRAVGVPCGIMDQAVSVLGRAGHAILLDTRSLEHEAVPLPPELALVVIDSGVRHRLEDSGYAARQTELQQALPVLEGRLPRDVDPAELEGLLAPLEPIPARRLRHVVTENRRVTEVVEVLTELGLPRRARLGELFREGHDSLRDDFEVSTPDLDLLVDLAYTAGAVAARMTGGGFGGSIVALVEQDRAETLAEEVVAAYGSDGKRQATARICHASDGAREL